MCWLPICIGTPTSAGSSTRRIGQRREVAAQLHLVDFAGAQHHQGAPFDAVQKALSLHQRRSCAASARPPAAPAAAEHGSNSRFATFTTPPRRMRIQATKRQAGQSAIAIWNGKLASERTPSPTSPAQASATPSSRRSSAADRRWGSSSRRVRRFRRLRGPQRRGGDPASIAGAAAPAERARRETPPVPASRSPPPTRADRCGRWRRPRSSVRRRTSLRARGARFSPG